MHQFLTALNRPVQIINLDPANPDPSYPCALSITSLVSLEDIMAEHTLGPNGGMLYAMEYLEANFDWLEEGLERLRQEEEERWKVDGDGGGSPPPPYFIFDTPGQVELWTNHESLKRIVNRLVKQDYRLVVLHLSDAHYITEPAKFISVLLLALRAMLQMELPHVNVLSKMDLLAGFGELDFNLSYYTEVQDLSYLADTLDADPRNAKYKSLNRAICELVEDFGLVGFETLAVEDKASMLKLLRLLDKVLGYAYIPPAIASSANTTRTSASTSVPAIPLSELTGLGDVNDVQERWVDRKEEYDKWEEEKRKKQEKGA